MGPATFLAPFSFHYCKERALQWIKQTLGLVCLQGGRHFTFATAGMKEVISKSEKKRAACVRGRRRRLASPSQSEALLVGSLGEGFVQLRSPAWEGWERWLKVTSQILDPSYHTASWLVERNNLLIWFKCMEKVPLWGVLSSPLGQLLSGIASVLIGSVLQASHVPGRSWEFLWFKELGKG